MIQLQNMCSNTKLLHKSNWAVTTKTGNIVTKYFFYPNFEKICKEVSLLNLSSKLKIKLMFDVDSFKWYYEMPYIDLYPFHVNCESQTIFNQLHKVFNIWDTDKRYEKLIKDEWNTINLPYYTEILTRYVRDNNDITSYLLELKSEHFIHGDFTISNVYCDKTGNIIILDYENATRGPYKWDESTYAYSFIENMNYDMAKIIINEFQCPKQMILSIAAIRLAQTRRKQQDDTNRLRAYQYILENFK